MKAEPKDSKTVPTLDLRLADLAEPVDANRPCGDDLEYDAEFLVLQAKAASRESAQYGDFVAPAETPNWTELERDCRRLLLRTKDIRLFTLLLRCRTRMAHAEGLRDGLALLHAMLVAYPEQVHPQLIVDGDVDPALRANALAALTDPRGLLADVREISLAGNSAVRLQVRDIERALGSPRPQDALSPEYVRQQLEALRRQGAMALAAMDEASRLAISLQQWCRENMPDFAPNLDPLIHLLVLAGNPELVAPPLADNKAPAAGSSTNTSALNRAPAIAKVPTGVQLVSCEEAAERPADRRVALMEIRNAREWFECHEPSSPVALLLRRAEQLVGKPFAEVFQTIPADLVEIWTREEK